MQYKTKSGKTLNINDKNEINRGGEGRIVLIDNENDKVAKIYHTPQSNILEQKLLYLNSLDKNVFITPEELLYKKTEFVGYTMQLVDNSFFPISAIFSKNYCTQNVINQDYKKEIIEKLYFAVENAHNNNIVIGDLNQYNILINKNADLKIIDTDSFETPINKHSGILLEEIRDYYYNGLVNKNSDYFAFSILVFYMLTFTHPFKGVHKLYKSIRERMINKIPVFVGDSNLIVPNMYEPISDNSLQNKFEQMYLNGDRFLISFKHTKLIQITTNKQVTITKFEENNLVISPIINDKSILKVYSNSELGYIKTDKEFIIFSTKSKGNLQKKFTINSSEYENIYIGNDNILLKKGSSFFHFIDYNKIVELKNFELNLGAYIEQKENILIVIEEDKMFYVFIDEIMNNSIKIQRTEVFGKSFNFNNGLIQNTGGIKRIFYKTDKTLNNIKVDKNIKFLSQNKNIGIMQFVENKEVKTSYFVIKENNIIFDTNELQHAVYYAYMYNQNAESYIFETDDKKIKLLRTTDFKEISNYQCSLVNANTKIEWTKAGLLCSDEQNVFLVNNK